MSAGIFHDERRPRWVRWIMVVVVAVTFVLAWLATGWWAILTMLAFFVGHIDGFTMGMQAWDRYEKRQEVSR